MSPKETTILGYCRKVSSSYWKKPANSKTWNFRTKWDSWSALGDMSKEKAMQLYVDELRQIIETMSFNENVADFVGSLGQLEKVDFGDLETVAPEAPIIKMAHTHPDSPYISRTNSPSHGTPPPINGLTTSNLYFNQNGRSSASLDQSDEEYIDTVEVRTHIFSSSFIVSFLSMCLFVLSCFPFTKKDNNEASLRFMKQTQPPSSLNNFHNNNTTIVSWVVVVDCFSLWLFLYSFSLISCFF